MNKKQLLSGFKDLLPPKARKKKIVLRLLEDTLNSFGYDPIETPHLEYKAVLVADADGDSDQLKQIYSFEDNGGRKVALRFDHTVPLARFLSSNLNEIKLPFKRYVLGNVFRGESPQYGRYREFTQCDFDVIGSDSILFDAEILQIIYSTLQKIGLTKFVININHRSLLDGLIAKFSAEEHKQAILRITDKLPKLGFNATAELLNAKGIFTLASAEKWLNLIQTKFTSWSELNQFIKEKIGFEYIEQELLAEIEYFYMLIKNMKIPQNNYTWNLSIARGLDYYSGFVFETFLAPGFNVGKHNSGEIGSICSGGRYSELSYKVSGKQHSGVGASIGLDRVLDFVPDDIITKNIKILVAPIDTKSALLANSFSSNLRKHGFDVLLHHALNNIGRHFDYAQKCACDYVIIFGEREAGGGPFILANLETGLKSEHKNLTELIEFIT